MGPHSFWDLVRTAIFSFLLLLSGCCWSPCCLARLDGDIRYVAIDYYGDMLNAFCFRGRVYKNFEGFEGDHSSTRQMCCFVLQSALEKEGTRLIDRTKVYQECLKQGTALPEYSDSLLLPVYAFFYNSNRAIPPHNAASSWRVPAPPEDDYALSTISKRSVWDYYGRHGRWLSLDDDDALHFQSWLGNNDSTTTAAAAAFGVPVVHLESQLLPSGGMHRDLRHRITLQNKQAAAAAVTTITTLILALQIPYDLFVNVEDLVRVETTAGAVVGTVRLVRHNTTVIIDQEEPAFVSPPHALLLEITIDNNTTDTTTTLFQFVTKLHVRYPLPVSGDDEGSFRLVVMPPPRLLAATSTTTSNSEPITTTILSSRHEQPLSLWVAAGRQEHYWFTLGVTFLASVVGAVIMLRDIARISTWD